MTRDLLALVALLGLSAGCWMAWAPLGLIVPSALLLGGLVWTHTRNRGESK